MTERTERAGKFRTMRSAQDNRLILKKYEGAFLPFGSLFMALPTKTWQLNEHSTAERPWVDFKCDVCGFVHSIRSKHTIDDEGNVNQSYGRESVSGVCGLHEWLKLEGWKP